MHHDEGNDQGHTDEMHVTRGVVTAEQRGEPLQLHRLPDRQARQHDKHADHDHAGVEQFLHVIVLAQIVVRELASQRSPGIRDYAVRRDRQQLLAEAAGGKPKREIDQAVDHQNPHRGEMPEQRAAEPAAKRDGTRKAEVEQRRGVIDLPSRHDHQDHGKGVDPMQQTHPGRLDDLCRSGRGDLLFADGGGRHGCSLLKPVTSIYARNLICVTAMRAVGFMHAARHGHKKASRVAPARLSSCTLLGGCWVRGLFQDDGISTVSTTWITPFDWLTFEIVTIEVPPLASTIQTLPSWCFTVSSSPSAVLSFLPSVSFEASSLPGTTW